MKQLNDGHVPDEIRKPEYRDGGVRVNLDDRRKEEYRPPTPPKYVAFSGSGANLGGASGQGLAVNKEVSLPIVDES